MVDDAAPQEERPAEPEGSQSDPQADEILQFWETARGRAGLGKVGVVIGVGATAAVPPPAWSFGDTPELANELLDAVLRGEKTATSSSAWEYDEETPLPVVGELAIILDGQGHPRALIRTVSVDVVPFTEVEAAFAQAEGEGDGSLEQWKQSHRENFARSLVEREFAEDMPVVCERFEVRYPVLR